MSFDKWADDLAERVGKRYDWTNADHRRRMFACQNCGTECSISPGYGMAICNACCPDHDYVYQREWREHRCEHCDDLAPYDYYDN